MIRRWVDSARGVLWPGTCLVCGQSASPRLDCCPGCREDFPVAAGRCRRCALPLPRDVDLCGGCIGSLPAFDAAFAAHLYAPPLDHLVHRFKFSRDLAAGRILADLMAHRLAELGAPRPDLMIPVPLHWRRRWQRGFNQAEFLCRDLSRLFGGLPWMPALARRRPTAAQSALPAGRRRGNVRGAFRGRRLAHGTTHVALVDDVMTTGATVQECARTLRRAGVKRVDVWVAGRA